MKAFLLRFDFLQLHTHTIVCIRGHIQKQNSMSITVKFLAVDIRQNFRTVLYFSSTPVPMKCLVQATFVVHTLPDNIQALWLHFTKIMS